MLGHFLQFPQGGMNQCYKYRVGEYIAKGPKRNYRIYRQKCRQTSAIYRQNKKYKNIKNTKKRKKSQYIWKNRQISPKIGKYRDKIGKYREKIEKNRQKTRKILGWYISDISPVSYHRDISRCCRYIDDVCNTARNTIVQL